MAPAGWIARTDKDGSHWEMFCAGLRNSYDIAFNTCFARDWHDHRAIMFAHSSDAVIAALQNFASGTEKSSGMDQGVAIESAVGPAFIYSGNGSQWIGMAKTLLAEDTAVKT